MLEIWIDDNGARSFFVQGYIRKDIEEIMKESMIRTVKSTTTLRYSDKNQRQIDQAKTVTSLLEIDINYPDYLDEDKTHSGMIYTIESIPECLYRSSKIGTMFNNFNDTNAQSLINQQETFLQRNIKILFQLQIESNFSNYQGKPQTRRSSNQIRKI